MINRIKENKLLMILMILIIGVLFILAFRITHAYLTQETEGAKKNIVGESNTVDQLKLIPGNALSLNVTSTTLPENGSNLVVESKHKVSLLANSTNSTALQHYYLNLKIDNNLEYSTENHIPEIILMIIDPMGNEIQNLDGLTYATTYGVSGFDITTFSGDIKITDNYEIRSTSSKEATIHEWTFKITYMNLGVDQSINYDKGLTTSIEFGKVEKETLANYIISTVDADNTLYKHSEALENGAADNEYRYSGASDEVYNYICFGTNEKECPEDNLYRIIGVFDNKVKLIKNKSIEKQSWDSNKGSDWTNATLKTYLNSDFYDSFGESKNKIYKSKWYLGQVHLPSGENPKFNLTAKDFYTAERQSDVVSNEYIGLMNPSDYGYAASTDSWATYLSKYSEDILSKNWLADSSSNEWTITTTSDYDLALFLGITNVIDALGTTAKFKVRPVFFLNSDVILDGGSGTLTDPYRIK